MWVVEASYGSVEVNGNVLGGKRGEKDRVDKRVIEKLSFLHRHDTFTKRPVFVVVNCPPTEGAVILGFSGVFFSSTKSTALAQRESCLGDCWSPEVVEDWVLETSESASPASFLPHPRYKQCPIDSGSFPGDFGCWGFGRWGR